MAKLQVEQINKMRDILKEHGISMNVGGCGCCGSPFVTFKYEDFELDLENCRFDTDELTEVYDY